jgi:hypothetical protein
MAGSKYRAYDYLLQINRELYICTCRGGYMRAPTCEFTGLINPVSPSTNLNFQAEPFLYNE